VLRDTVTVSYHATVKTETTGVMIQSVQRATRLLRAFESGPVEQGVSELSRRVALHKSTVSRLLATLEREGLLDRVPETDKYRLGFGLVRLAGRVSHFRDVRATARPVLLALTARTRETVNLAVLDGDHVVNVEQLSGPHLVRDTNWVGRRTPLHCVANGKALLAACAPPDVERILSGPLPRFTERTIADPQALRRELAAVRERGYAQALGEIEEGLNAVAAPVRDAAGAVIAAVSVSGPAYRVTADRIAELGALVAAAAAEISDRLGFVGPEEGRRERRR
jgi:DNA-binding IclR family transcriptional regulator